MRTTIPSKSPLLPRTARSPFTTSLAPSSHHEPQTPRCPFPPTATPPPSTDATLAIPAPYRHATLTAHQKHLIRRTIPSLEAHGLAITTLFYTNLLAASPGLHDIFNVANQTHMEQPRALADAVLAYARNLDDLAPLAPTVQRVAAKHASLFVRPEQYAVVADHLLAAVAAVLGADVVTQEVAAAWTVAYWVLARVFIEREQMLYRRAEGWTDWAEFRIARKVVESDEVTSFYLEPVDGSMKPLPRFLPGQVS
jgi:nitric oxide dioxygenase